MLSLVTPPMNTVGSSSSAPLEAQAQTVILHGGQQGETEA